MKKYLLLISDEKLWKKFSERYYPELGENLNDAILELIQRYVDGKDAK